MENKLKLSEIIKTDCYIDCGSNEKLREVVKVLPIKPDYLQLNGGIYSDDIMVRIYRNPSEYLTIIEPSEEHPIHHISQIDLNS